MRCWEGRGRVEWNQTARGEVEGGRGRGRGRECGEQSKQDALGESDTGGAVLEYGYHPKTTVVLSTHNHQSYFSPWRDLMARWC